VTKGEVIKKIGEILKTDFDFDFLEILRVEDLETLIACVRDRVDQVSEG